MAREESRSRKEFPRKQVKVMKAAAAKAAGASSQRSFREALSQLTLHQATRLLGERGSTLLQEARNWLPEDFERDVYLGEDLLRFRVNDQSVPGGNAFVIISQENSRRHALRVICDVCHTPCCHAGAAMHFLMSNKLPLGLAAPPDESVPFELLTPEELRERALDERRQRAREQAMTLSGSRSDSPWTDYTLSSHSTGKTYRVALRGREAGESYCSCPDYRTNGLGTCKHILHALGKLKKRFTGKQLKEPAPVSQLALRLNYCTPPGSGPKLELLVPEDCSKAVRALASKHPRDQELTATAAMSLLHECQRLGEEVRIYPDAEHWIERELTCQQLREATADIRRNPAMHPLRTTLLKSPLLPYQMDGVAFAVGAGRAILADDMGLGKTIQGIGVAELLAQLVGISRVLVVCPASVKSQWLSEIQRFTDRSGTIVNGNAQDRRAAYECDSFFKICNYEQVVRDLSTIDEFAWDLVILDEGQRIKNWESRTSRSIRSLRSRFALVLSGTPLENRLDELYTVVKFVDEHRLGPAHEFFHKHRQVDDNGRVLAVRKLDELRQQLKPVLLRRTRVEIRDQLPERTNTIVRFPPTPEQYELHSDFMLAVAKISRKSYLTEMDLMLLQKSLLLARMTANATALVNPEQENYSSKLSHLEELLTGLADDPTRKIVLFSEWKRMHDLIEPLLQRAGLRHVRLDGSVPQARRGELVQRFQTDADCRVILLTNAGSTGLNLQAANTVINVDLPWNPAVLEQRIARAHRMGQKNPVHVYILVTEGTIEERLLDTLASKQELASAALDADSDIQEVEMRSGLEELRRRVEKLLGTPAPVAVPVPAPEVLAAPPPEKQRERVAAASGQLLGAALQLVGELVSSGDRPAPSEDVVNQLRAGLERSMERDEAGRPQLRFTLPDDSSVASLAQTLARLLVSS